MISPKYARTNYYRRIDHFSKAPHVVNLYLDYNCPFSALLYLKIKNHIIPKLEKKHPKTYQFVFVNVVQPWHPNSIYLNEFSFAVSKQLRSLPENADTNKIFWDVSEIIFENKELFYDSATALLNRNETYEKISSLVFSKLDLPISKDSVLQDLYIRHEEEPGLESNDGNKTSVDIKYFTRYLRNVGIHMTPTVSINNIVADSISSGTEAEELVKVFESYL